MDCTSCGLTIDPDIPWFGVYAWDAFIGNPLEAMVLHEACFTAGEFIEATWWENDPETNEAMLRTETQRRLIRVASEGMWWRREDDEMVPVPESARAMMRRG